MFRSFATGFYPRFVQKRLGVKPIGAFDTMLLATGTSLLVRKQKPLLGIAFIVGGTYRSWKSARSECGQVCDPA